MSERKQRWIVIPNWDGKKGEDGLQHYKDRDPVWIKNYRRLLAKDEYLGLSFHRRGILHSLWLEYAASNRQISDSTLTLTRRLGQRVTTRDLEALNHAGFIRLVASKPLAPRYRKASPEKEVEKKKKGLKPLTSTGTRDVQEPVAHATGQVNGHHNDPAKLTTLDFGARAAQAVAAREAKTA